MANSTSHGTLPYPIINARFSIELQFRTSAGTPTDPTSADTEFSTDGGATFSDCAEEITTGGANGMGYVTLTGAETNSNILGIAAKSSNCLTTGIVLHPRVLAIVGSGTLSAGSAGGGTLGTLLAYDVTGCFIRTTGGTGGGGTGGANNQARKIVTYNTTTGAFTVTPNWETTPSTDTTYDVLLPEGVTLGMLKTLNPTTAGRTFDVAATGEGGLDFNNVLSSQLVTLHSLTISGATTLSGAVSLGSTLSVTGATTLAALSMTTLTASGAVAFQSTLAVTGTTTLTGAVSATNASNDIRGIALHATQAAYAPAKAGDAMTLTAAYDSAKTAASVAAIFANAIESGVTFAQLMEAIGAVLAGKRSNAGTATEQYDALGNPGTARVVGNLDSSGNGTPTLTL